MNQKDIPLPSNKTFGLFFAGVFWAIALYLFWHDSILWSMLCALIGKAFLIVTFVAREALTPLNRLWMRFGLLLSMIVSPIVLGILFFGVVTPVAMFGRFRGRDELRLKRSEGFSHWRLREPAGPPPDSFSNQF